MKVHPIIMRPRQLWEYLETRRFFLPLRIEIHYSDIGDHFGDREILHDAELTLQRLNYDLSSHRNEAAREDVFTATQRNPIQHLLRATREAMAERMHTEIVRLYRDMGLAEEEVLLAFREIYYHVQDEQNAGCQLSLLNNRFPSSWQQPRYEWCRADARPPRTAGIREWANESLGIPFEATQRPSRPRRAIPHNDMADAARLAAMAALAAPPGSNLLDFLEQQGRDVAATMGIPAYMLDAFLQTTGNGGQTRLASATPTPVAPPPPPKPPALLLQPRGRFLTLPTP